MKLSELKEAIQNIEDELGPNITVWVYNITEKVPFKPWEERLVGFKLYGRSHGTEQTYTKGHHLKVWWDKELAAQ